MILVFVTFILCGLSCVGLVEIMRQKKIENKLIRKWLVNVCKIIMCCVCMLSIVGVILSLFDAYGGIYNFIYTTSLTFSKSVAFARYASLTVILVGTQPSLLLLLKILKKKMYENNKDIKEIRDMGTNFLNTITYYLREIPVKGIIHVINLFLVVAANSLKALDIETNLTTATVYMSVATFYALDRVMEYFLKQYNSYWHMLDNKLFNTKEIDGNAKFNIRKLKNTMDTVFFHYIETGRYDWK